MRIDDEVVAALRELTATLFPAAAANYALHAAWRERWDLRRYGFHGLSHAYASRRAAELTGAAQIITCHLGAGASLVPCERRPLDRHHDGLHAPRRARNGRPPRAASIRCCCCGCASTAR